MKKITIKDVAKQAGVSISTVSNALNPESKKISDSKREQVLAVVEELNYVPDSRAQALSSSNKIKAGLLIKNSHNFDVDNTINMQIIYHLNKEANEKEIELVNIFSVKDNETSYELLMKKIQTYGLTHLVIFGLDRDGDIVSKIRDLAINKIFIDVPMTGKNTSFIAIDNYEAQRALLHYVYNQQHYEQLVYIAGDLKSYVGVERLRAVTSFCNKKKVDLKVGMANFDKESGYREIQKIDFNKDALIVCGCDSTAIGVIQHLKEKRYSNLVLGFDGIGVMSYISNNFVTVKQNYGEMAKSALEMIINEDMNPKIFEYKIADLRENDNR